MDKIIRKLNESDEILVASHSHPDGDAIGSLLALGLALEARKKRVLLYNESPVPAVYQFLPSIHRIKSEIGSPNNFKAAVILDCSELPRVGKAADIISKVPCIINIDHHITNSGFGNLQMIDPRASATAELVHKVIKGLGVHVTKAMAYAIYTAIMTDTGSFRFSNTTPEAFAVCHEMVTCGADPYKVAHHVYETVSLNRIRLLNMTFDTIELSENGKMSVMTLTQDMLEATGTKIQDVNGLINYAKQIENVKVAALIYERRKKTETTAKGEIPDESLFHVSLRSDGSVDVALIASVFGGGGHVSAAGFDIHGTLPQIKSQLFEISKRL